MGSFLVGPLIVEQYPANVLAEMGLDHSGAGIDICAEQGIGIIERAPHSRILRALAGEHEYRARCCGRRTAVDPQFTKLCDSFADAGRSYRGAVLQLAAAV